MKKWRTPNREGKGRAVGRTERVIEGRAAARGTTRRSATSSTIFLRCAGRIPGKQILRLPLSDYRNKLVKMPNPINQRHRGWEAMRVCWM